jgi:ATP-dependent DNA helicase RecG
MTETNDGFEIARRDLELRGPGDYFGTKQSGLPEFRLADLISDFEVLESARDDVAALLIREDFWTSLEYLSFRQFLQREQIFGEGLLD